jgi:hypothetical protein
MDTVHAIWDFYDRPRTGVASFLGQPNYFFCQWDDAADDYSCNYALSPIDADTFELVLQQSAIWQKWELAFHAGQVSSESHPSFGGRDPRYDQLQVLLQARIEALPTSSSIVQAKFFPVSADRLSNGVMQPLLVQWSDAA